MQFRHPSGVRVASTSGHCAVIGPEWRDLPPFLHADALAAGCECNQGTFKAEKVEPQSSPEAAARPTNHDDVIRQALELMLARKGDPDCTGDFTADNTPNAKVVGKLASMNVRKEDVMRVFRDMQAEAAEGEE